MCKKILILALTLAAPLTADPWGKDCDLVEFDPCDPPCCEARSGIASKVAQGVIRFHQEVISPADGPRSHFRPSSSQYALEGTRKYGFVTGFIMACDRLQRENPELWVYRTIREPDGTCHKWDPVR